MFVTHTLAECSQHNRQRRCPTIDEVRCVSARRLPEKTDNDDMDAKQCQDGHACFAAVHTRPRH
jgi:hypothetical protein